jgi:hypothetical protein
MVEVVTMTTEAQLERRIDAAVQERLAHDRAYRNAANAEEQAAREEEIEREETRRIVGRDPWDEIEVDR